VVFSLDCLCRCRVLWRTDPCFFSGFPTISPPVCLCEPFFYDIREAGDHLVMMSCPLSLFVMVMNPPSPCLFFFFFFPWIPISLVFFFFSKVTERGAKPVSPLFCCFCLRDLVFRSFSRPQARSGLFFLPPTPRLRPLFFFFH